jgi:hypothetical protein
MSEANMSAPVESATSYEYKGGVGSVLLPAWLRQHYSITGLVGGVAGVPNQRNTFVLVCATFSLSVW